MLQGLYGLGFQRPAKNADSPVDEVIQRGNNLGEVFVQETCPDGLTAYLNEGSYFNGVLSGYAPGTGQVASTQQTFSDTSALLMLKNNAPLNGVPITVRPDTLKLIVSNVGAGITAMRLVAVLDDVSRWPAAPGGAAMAFAGNANVGLVQSSISVAQFGALSPNAATSNKRIVGQCVLKAAAPVLNDEFIIRFSNAGQPSGGLAGSTAISIVRHMEPVLIAPGKVLILHLFCAGVTTGAQFEPQLSVIER